MESGDKYLRVLFGFLGIADFTTIAAEELDVWGKDVKGIVGKAVDEAKKLALSF